ncbi:glutamate-1-semialdehyde 2,1-aminomutase [Xanthovirga aplysinae]|uniref:glutamate-1-semialdehyde 2,1-aminomutase n=1 Tax=Xanthovirga aplysinae TaxID=2529853 RepID=UPI0012BC0E78|nr:glutamate-1-semialdehyde 2,1-aminomutase [Xanthovirga aplysinae]MTI30285.1 glutamate-1-semialdehyde 2,1-aminomutase [Xanthovirga aplysinae]
MNFKSSLKLQKRLHQLIPGGCHTYAKGDDQFPEFMPPILEKGKGSHVWDLDGNKYIEYGGGLRSVILGHAFPPIINAVQKQLRLGSNFIRPAKIEYDCAEEFLQMIEMADMVKFCKDGSDATSAAVKLARAVTGRDIIAICSSHPFFSVEDWFIGTTPVSSGIPKVIKELTVKFEYNNINSVKEILKKYSNQIAGFILEPEKNDPPKNNFLHQLKEICHQNGALFILDEMITGLRWHNGGAQKLYNIKPDLSTFGKALGNGFSVSALAGKKEFMELGGLQHSKKRVFLLSTTHGAENHCLAAAIANIKFFKENPVIESLNQRGEKLALLIQKSVRELKLEKNFLIIGKPSCLVYATLNEKMENSQAFRTLLLQELIKRGILATSLVISFSHTEKDIDITAEAFHEALFIYKKALNEGIEKFLIGRPVKPVWRAYN